MKDFIIGAIAVVVLLVGGIALLNQHAAPTPPAGSSASPDHYELQAFYSGLIRGGLVSTTSQATAETLGATELRAWLNSSEVSYSPGLTAAETITLPASSTLAGVLPHPGDSQRFCVRNATTTAGTQLTFAGSTGINLVVASSSATSLGGTLLRTGKVGCFEFIRQPSTATTYDFDALFTVYN